MGWNEMTRFQSVILGVAVIALSLAGPAQGQPVVEVVIFPAAVEPETVRTVLGTTVAFRNRSGRPIEVQFVGYRGWHHVSETPEGAVVIFHRAGRHPFVVRFSGSDQGHVHGVVEVDAASRPPRSTPVCTTVKVQDVCLEP